MRHIRARRRYRVILVFLLLLCVTLFVENRIEALMPELKSYAEARVERSLGGRVNLSIGNISGGVLQPIRLNDITIRQVKAPALLNWLTIDSINTNYRIWELVKIKKTPSPEDILEKDSAIYVTFSLHKGNISGFAGIEGDLENSRFSGYVRVPGWGKVEFTGAVKGDNFDLAVRPEEGGGLIRLIGNIDDDGGISANFKIDHIKINRNDISCDGTVKHRIMAQPQGLKGGLVEGELEAREIILNHKILLPLKAGYSISNGIVDIKDLRLGESFRIYGSFSLNKTGPIDMTLLVNNVSLAWLYQQFEARSASSILTGTVNGKLSLSGSRRRPHTSAHFDIRKGTMADMDFDYLSANLKGDVPFLKIEEARVTRQSGYFAIAGELDMDKAGKASFFENVTLVTDDGAITWDDWKMVKRQDVREINMTKNLTTDIGFSYKKFITDQKIDESMRDSDKISLQYKLSPSESLGMMVGQNENFFGFEHKDKF